MKNPEHRLPCSLLRPTALLGTNRSHEQNTEPDVDGHDTLSIHPWAHKGGEQGLVHNWEGRGHHERGMQSRRKNTVQEAG